MPRILVMSHDAFSDQNANGKTLKALLCQCQTNDLAQFYTGTQNPDSSFCNSYFRVTDMQMLKSFFKRQKYIVPYSESMVEHIPTHSSISKKSYLVSFLYANNYNFVLRWSRELLRLISRSWRSSFNLWLESFQPEAILYMVGDSIFYDILVRKVANKFNIPIILFNVEAYRIINVNERQGLEKLFYSKLEESYSKFKKFKTLSIYNSDILRDSYQEFYKQKDEKSILAHNCSAFDTKEYSSKSTTLNIVYFGNLGVGRVSSLIDIADALQLINPKLRIDVYGNAASNDADLMYKHSSIEYHGLISAKKLVNIKENADILLQVESFDPDIMMKLRFAFSTKIAQCLCSGRCLVSFAPNFIVSTKYLLVNDAAIIIDSKESLKTKLEEVVFNHELREKYAKRALEVASQNHSLTKTGNLVKRSLNEIIYEN